MAARQSERFAILKLHQAGQKPIAIFKSLQANGVKKSTVYSVIKRFTKTGSVNDRSRSGRPRSVRSKNCIRNLKARMKRNPQRSENWPQP